MKKTNKWSLGLFGIFVIGILGLALIYPEQFTVALVGLIVGFGGGMLIPTTLIETYFNKGADMTHELQKKQVINPTNILREARLQNKENQASPNPVAPKQQSIPRFNPITGLDN